MYNLLLPVLVYSVYERLDSRLTAELHSRRGHLSLDRYHVMYLHPAVVSQVSLVVAIEVGYCPTANVMSPERLHAARAGLKAGPMQL